MTARNVLVYYAWSREEECSAPLQVIENRFPTLFESRRLGFPRFEELSDPSRFPQGIEGFLDHIMKANFEAFVELAAIRTGRPVREIERADGEGRRTPLDNDALAGIDTLVVISFDSVRTAQAPDEGEAAALRDFLSKPDHLAFIGMHHDIGNVHEATHEQRLAAQVVEFLHHGDRSIPPQQRFGGFARALLERLDVPVSNRFGLRPAAEPDGSPSPIETATALDRLHLLDGVPHFNLHPHLPHLERLGNGARNLDVLARQRIELRAPPHPFARERSTFDALLQSRPGVFAGTLLVGDATLWSSTAGGVDALTQLWTNVLQRPSRP